MNHRRTHFIIFILAAALALTACSPSAPTAPAELTPIRVQLPWLPTIEYSPFYLAEAEGYYAEEGISGQFLSGGVDDAGNPISEIDVVVSGQAEFGITGAEHLLAARAEGAPLVAFATLYQRNPIAFISLAENNITTPHDFIGKKVFVDATFGSTGIAYTAMMAELGIDRSQIEEIPRDDYSLEPLTSGRVDVVSAFVNNQPVALELEGYDVNVILASDYGVDSYANVLFTTEDMLNNNPDLVQRFLRATLKGIQSAVSDPEEAVEVTLAQSDELNAEAELQSMTQAVPLFKPAGSEVGMMQDSDWAYIAETMIEQGLLPASTDVKAAYTMDFLNEIYSTSASR